MDDVFSRVLDQLSQDARALLDTERRPTALNGAARSELAGYDLDAPLCSGHDHADEEDFIVDD